MKLKEYFALREQWLRDNRHPKTVNETRVAVEAFCEWLGSDPKIDAVTTKMVDEFEADKSSRRRQLVSNLCGLLRLYDPQRWPRKNKTMFALATMRREIIVEVKTRRKKIRTLSEFAAVYIAQRTLSAGYANTLAKRAAQYEQWHGSTAIKDLLTEDALNSFLAALDGTGSPWTLIKWRQDLLTLWASAADDDLCEYPRPRRIRRPKKDAPNVECYTPDETRLLVSAAGTLSGYYERTGVARRVYWPALIRFAWDTGLRRGDCFRWERESLQADGTFRLTQQKTRKPIRRMIRPATISAIDKIDLAQPLSWGLENEWSFGHQFQRIVVAAGLERGSFKGLRRATGSEVEAAHPGAGHRALGNTTQVFNTHYNADLAGEVLMPPEL